MAKTTETKKGEIPQLQLYYLSKGDMSKALAAQRGITLPDARSRVSNARVKSAEVTVTINSPQTGHRINIGKGTVFETPERWLEWDGTVKVGRPKKKEPTKDGRPLI